MKRILAMTMGMLLCLHSICAAPLRAQAEEAAVREGTAQAEEGTQETAEQEEAAQAEEGTQEAAAQAEATEQEAAEQEAVAVNAPSAILMESSTGEVIYEKDADTPRPPASVTKVMTMLLIFDALAAGKIQLTDEVSVSEFAASMGGSQVYLEPGETQTVDTMLKCISVASANDACVSFQNRKQKFYK